MRKGSLVQLRENKGFRTDHILRAYHLGILLPRHDQVLTLAKDPIPGTCTCGEPNCENGTMLEFEETPGLYGMGMFEEIQVPEVVDIVEILSS